MPLPGSRRRLAISALGLAALVPRRLRAQSQPKPDPELEKTSTGCSRFHGGHGARNLDTVLATVDALPLVVEKGAGRIPVLVDGGVRRGTDVVKALALGAAAVEIGWALFVGTGPADLASIDRSVLW